MNRNRTCHSLASRLALLLALFCATATTHAAMQVIDVNRETGGELNVGEIFYNYERFTYAAGSFMDVYNFTLAGGASGSRVLLFPGLKPDPFGIENLMWELYSGFNQSGGSTGASGDVGFDSIGGLSGGADYSLVVSGDVTSAAGGAYNLFLKAVPIPAPVLLFASGLAGLFLIGRRNRAPVARNLQPAV